MIWPLLSTKFCTGSCTAFCVFLASLTPTIIGAASLSLLDTNLPWESIAPGNLNFFLRVLSGVPEKKLKAWINLDLPSILPYEVPKEPLKASSKYLVSPSTSSPDKDATLIPSII